MKKVLITIMVLIIGLSCGIANPSISEKLFSFKAGALDNTSVISIDKKFLKTDCALKVNNPDNYTLRYYVGDNKINCDELILSSDYYEKWIKVEAYNGEECVGSDKAFFSKLPVLYINTDDGKNITSKTEYKSGNMFVQNNTEAESEMYNGALQIKGRGNTSWVLPKKPYKIKLDKKTDLFGMGKNKHYVLLSNYIDESFLRNETGFQVARELGMYAPGSVWTELILNGKHVGNYQLCEQIRVDKNRVNIFDWESEAENLTSAVVKAEKKKGNDLDKNALEDTLKEDLKWVTSGKFTFNEIDYTVSDYYEVQKDISGGYLFELSEEYDEVSKFTTRDGLRIMLKSPEYLATNIEMMNYVNRFWTEFEIAYKSEDGYVSTYQGRFHYSELADLDSMVSYWLVMEILGNEDAYKKSRFASKDIGKPLEFGPVWDFDWGCGSFVVSDDPTGWKVTTENSKYNFYKDFLDDPLFISKATERYWQIRPFLKSLVKDNGIIDNETAYLKESGIADHILWDRQKKYSWLNGNPKGFLGDASAFKEYLTNRIDWLDKQFEKDTTLLSSTKTDYSACPYIKSDDQIQIDLLNCGKDNSSEHAAADGVIDVYSNLNLRVKTFDNDTVTAKVYVNGLYCSDIQFENGESEFSIDKEYLTEDIDYKNVISIIGKDLNEKTTYKNFTTVKKTHDNIYTDSNGNTINLFDTFIPNDDDIVKSNINLTEFKNLEILGVQKKKTGEKSIRYIVVAKDNILKDADEYGFIVAGDTTIEKARSRISGLTYDNSEGYKFNVKGTSNNVSGDYGKFDAEKDYKYVTFGVNRIGDNSFAAKFYVKKGDKIYYATYTNNNGEEFNNYAVNWEKINK